MAIWLWHGIAVCGYLALWLHDYIAIELDGYVAIQLCHGMAVYSNMTITCNVAISACRLGREWPHTLEVLGVMARRTERILSCKLHYNVTSPEAQNAPKNACTVAAAHLLINRARAGDH